jgi:hypothetical protein
VVETFTDYNAFLSLLGQSAQVANFDDVPKVPISPDSPSYRYGYFDADRYASQGILIRASSGHRGVWSGPGFPAISPPNEYSAVLGAPGSGAPPTFRELSDLSLRISAYGRKAGSLVTRITYAS